MGNNMFAYCGNNPVANIDSSGMLFEKNVGGGGGFAYAGPVGGHFSSPTAPVKAPWSIPFIPLSTTYGTDSLRSEVIAIQKQRTQEREQVQAITIYNTNKNEAVYYGADIRGGTWKTVTHPMTYQEAKIWTVTTAIVQVYGKGASWGLYTAENDDAYTMAWDLGFGGIPIADLPKKGEFPHYHIAGRNFFGVYKHFHIWYGSIYGG